MNSVYEKNGAISDSNNDCLYSYDCCDIAPVLNIVAISSAAKNAIAEGLVGVWPKEFTLEAYKMVFQNNNIVHSFILFHFPDSWLHYCPPL